MIRSRLPEFKRVINSDPRIHPWSHATSNAELLEDGLLVTGIGMGVVVGVLVLLMFTIQGLGLFDRIVQRWQTSAAVLDAPSVAAAIPETPASEATTRGEIVAAIAAALALAEDESQVRHVLNNPPSGTSADAWAQAGRRHLMDQRGRPLR